MKPNKDYAQINPLKFYLKFFILPTKFLFSSFHPVLNKNLNKIIMRTINFIKCGHSSRVDVQRQTVNTSKIVASKEQDLHFEMLGQLWK